MGGDVARLPVHRLWNAGMCGSPERNGQIFCEAFGNKKHYWLSANKAMLLVSKACT